jgi:hypothetical protein
MEEDTTGLSAKAIQSMIDERKERMATGITGGLMKTLQRLTESAQVFS